METKPTIDLSALLERQRKAWSANPPDRAQRMADMAALREAVVRRMPDLVAAMQADFGHRSRHESLISDGVIVLQEIDHVRKHLRRWMRPKRRFADWLFWPARTELQYRAVGVVGIISPWNYPVNLGLVPLVTAIAAGNHVMLKPSEYTPHTSRALTELFAEVFPPERVSVVEGGAELAARFAALPFDHLFFTGSTAVGRKVAEAAARNLTPTTLELGGKSPCIIDTSCDLQDAALKIAHGKLLNAGQTCIAPDYVLLPRGSETAFADAYRAAVARLFPSIAGNQDYASIISPRHLARLRTMLQQAQTQGADVQNMDPAPGAMPDPAAAVQDGGTSRQMAPVLVFGATSGMQLMQEEIFGPILPVVSYERLDDAIAHINAGPRPLALYWFGTNDSVRDDVLARTVSGGVSVNDTLMHIAHDNLPFGGVGDSGWGAYHGESGYLRFCHQKSVLVQSRWAMGSLFYPPYGQRFDQVMGLLRRWL